MIDMGVLRKQVLFEGIEPRHLEYLAGIIKEVSLKKDGLLFKEGDPTKGLYLIKSGRIEISKMTPDGWRQTLAVVPEGGFFGELSIIEKRNHEATAKALENTEILKLLRDDFDRLEKENQELALQIMKRIALVMSNNLRRMNERFLKALVNY
jgi:CRP-like cAMP-binding protein